MHGDTVAFLSYPGQKGHRMTIYITNHCHLPLLVWRLLIITADRIVQTEITRISDVERRTSNVERQASEADVNLMFIVVSYHNVNCSIIFRSIYTVPTCSPLLIIRLTTLHAHHAAHHPTCSSPYLSPTYMFSYQLSYLLVRLLTSLLASKHASKHASCNAFEYASFAS